MSRTEEQARRERLGRLLREHGPGLGRVAASYARTAAEREDLMQEIALGLWRALPGFRGDCSERTFVFRVAHNQGLSLVSRRAPVAGDVEALEARLPDARPDPEESTGAAQRRARLFAALQRLPLGHRQVLTLALEELSHREIAGVLGITENNVAVRLSRAREALRQQLREAP